METKQRLWETRIADWKRSGLSQRQYCLKHELALATFGWWRKRLKERPENRAVNTFVEISRAQAVGVHPGGSACIRISVGRYTRAVTGAIDREQLASVLDVLERR